MLKHTNSRYLFFPQTISKWNALPTETRNSLTLHIFKSRLKNQLLEKAPPSYYNHGSKRANILHTRLRLGFSSLRSHLFKHNLIDSPVCECKSTDESIFHFFFDCNRHTAVRNTHLDNIIQICNKSNKYYKVSKKKLLEAICYGIPELGFHENCALFDIVHCFLTETKRF